jgi:methionyl-tRNA formyltransferase
MQTTESNAYVVASSKVWDPTMVMRLQKATGCTFHEVTEKSDLTLENLLRINPRFIFFPHWSFIVPDKIFQSFDCIIFHMTDLPYGRGGSPLQNLILRGHRETVICATQCIDEVDAGPIYLRRNLSLAGSAQEIYLRASEKIYEMILEIIRSEPNPEDQVGSAVLFERRESQDSELRDLNSLEELYDFIRMLDAEGYPRAFLNFKNFRIEFKSAVTDGDSVTASVLITDRTKDQNGC